MMEEEQIKELAEDEPFNFDCRCQVPCFNRCCRDLNQFLTPYDIIRLKNHLNLSSAFFFRTVYGKPYWPPDTPAGDHFKACGGK